MRSHQPLAIVLLLFLLLCGLYNWLIPPFEGPDGPQHFAYIEWLVQKRDFPTQGEAAWETPVKQEASQPPLYYLVASIPARLVNLSDPVAEFRPNPHFPSSAPGMVPDNKNIAIHYPADAHPLRGGWSALYLARGVSTGFGLLLIIAVYNLALLVQPKRPRAALMSALLVALTPQVLFICSIVSNDMAAAATCTWTLWLLVRLLVKGPSLGRGIAMGTGFGLAALSKTNSLALGLPLVIGLGWLWLKQPTTRTRTFWATIGTGGSSLLMAGWWYVRSWHLYGSPLGLNTHYFAPWALGEAHAVTSRTAEWLEVFYSTFAAFGWGNIKFNAWVYGLLIALVWLALFGIVMATLRYLKRKRRLGVVELNLLLLALTLVAVAAALERWMRQVTAPHGRLLFPALAAISVLLIIGWQKIHRWLPYLGIGLLGSLTVLAPITLIHPAYAPPATVELGDPAINWRFGSIAELHSVEPLSRSATAGESLSIRICWRPLAQAQRDYSILVHLVGPNNQVVASRYSYPGLGSYPTSTWQPDQSFCDQIPVDIPADLAQTLVYQIELGLIDYASMERLPTFDAVGKPLSHTFAGQVRLRAADSMPAAAPPTDGQPIQLINHQVPTRWTAGNAYLINLQWQATELLNRDYTVFIHLRNQAGDQNLAQADGPPLDGWYPTSWWTTEEIVTDTHQILVPADIPAGRYQMVVGWYDAATHEKLGTDVQLEQIEVQQP